MKELNGRELAGYIMERQAKTVRQLRQSSGLQPKLAIIRTNPDPVVDSYMRIKQNYGRDIGVDVDVHTIDQSQALTLIDGLNADADVHGIIVQIPLPDVAQTDRVLSSVAGGKDVDGLGVNARFDPATPLAISWLLAGYNVDLAGKQIVIVGNGRLVGKPLAAMWLKSGYNVQVTDRATPDLPAVVSTADIVVSATGVAGLIVPEMLKLDAVVVDAGVATDTNGLVGDVAASVREMPSITITPSKGGVGPLTVCALFENVLIAARRAADSSKV